MNPLNVRIIFLSASIALGCTLDARAQVLTADQIQQSVIGHSFEARRMGMAMRIAYDADGQVRMRSTMINVVGRWHLDGDQLCVTFETGPRRGTNCVHLTMLDDGSIQTSEGLLMRPAH